MALCGGPVRNDGVAAPSRQQGGDQGYVFRRQHHVGGEEKGQQEEL